MNVREGLISPRPALSALLQFRGDLDAFGQLVHAAQNDHIARLEALDHFRFIAVCRAEFDVSDGYCRIRVHHEDVGASAVSLHGGGRDEDDAVLLLQQEDGHKRTDSEIAVI